MNPRAVTFTPGTFSPEPGIKNDSHELLQSAQVPTSPREDRRDQESYRARDALDPENYDAMFPSLKTANQRTNPLINSGATPRGNRRQRRARKFERRHGRKIMELSSGPRPRAGSFALSSKAEEPYQEAQGTDASEALDVTEDEKKSVTFTPSPATPGQFKDKPTDPIQVTQNMPPTPKPERETTAEQHVPTRATYAGPCAPSAHLPTQTSPIPTPPFASPFGYPGTAASPLPWPTNGYFFYCAQNPLSYGPSYMSAAMPQAPQLSWNQPFTQPGLAWPATGPFNSPITPHAVPWQAAATQHLASTISSNPSARGTTQIRSESRPSSRGQPRSRVAASKASKPKQHSVESSNDHGIIMARLAPRTNATRRLTGNKQAGEKEKDAARNVEGNRLALQEDCDNLPGPAVSVTTDEHCLQNKTPSGEVFAFTANKVPCATKALAAFVSQRNPVVQDSLTQPRSTVSSRSAEIGTWSQSKRWVSAETKERTAFQKMLTNLHYMGADKSPFIPQNPAELTALKANAAESRKIKLLEKVGKLISKPNSEQNGQTVEAIFQGKKLEDDSSPVFGMNTCFNKEQASRDSRRVDWPSLAELKEEGDKRAAHHSRYFPLPRLNAAHTQISCEQHDQAYSPDGSTQWNMKEIKLGLAEITPSNAGSAYHPKDAPEFKIGEIPALLEEIINHINETETEVEGSRAE